jgi:S1-C subfamily serine protease
MKEQKIDMKYTPKESGKPWLGLLIIEIPEHLKNFYNIENGVHVGKVIPNSPAQNAGFRPGDVIIQFDGVSVKGEDEIKDIMEKKKAGDAVEVNFIRLKPVSLALNLQVKDKFNSMGWKMDNIPDSLQELYGSQHGLIIEQISSDSPAYKLGFKPFDLIVSADQQFLDDKDDFKKLLDSKPAGSQIKLTIFRLTGETMQTKVIIGIK